MLLEMEKKLEIGMENTTPHLCLYIFPQMKQEMEFCSKKGGYPLQ